MEMTPIGKEISGLVPDTAVCGIDWGRLENTAIGKYLLQMSETHQNPLFHGEDDVYTHTRMVCEELVRMQGYLNLPKRQRTELFLAALLHDIGKIRTTKLEDGCWVSPGHSAAGSHIVREFLWRDCGLCGDPEKIRFRETVCALVRYHMVPVHMLDDETPEMKIRKIASIGELAGDFSWSLLCILSEADMLGRESADTFEGVEKARLCAEMADLENCLLHPAHFAAKHTQRSYFSGRDVWPGQELYDDTWGEIILMSGLPGTGKDTWILENCRDMPSISLDDIRRRMNVRHSDDQGAVIAAAKEQAKEYLRGKVPFVWNATCLSEPIRGKLISLFEQYHASVKIVYLETEWSERIRRNENRHDAVPEDAVYKMLRTISVPMPWEARHVGWNVV